MSKSLYDLIKTLSKAEKRVFSENLKKTKRLQFYRKLIIVYSRADAYSSELDQKIFKSEPSKFIGDCKNTFKDLLFRYLVSLEKNKGLEQQIEEKLCIAKMLFRRKQFTESNKILDKIDQLAQIYEFHELMVEIKSFKIIIAHNMGMITKEIDLDYFEALIADKQLAMDRFAQKQIGLNNGWLRSVKTQIKRGATQNKVGKQKVSIDRYKNLKSTFLEKKAELSIYIHDNKLSKAFDTLLFILDLAEQHSKVVLKAKLLGITYPEILATFIELNYMINKNQDIEKFLLRFEDIKPTSIYEQCAYLFDKTIAYSVYALATNTPKTALVEIEKLELFFMDTNFSEAENFSSYSYYLFVFFATKQWDKCIEYIDIVDKKGGAKWNNSLLFLVRLICIYEKGELYYFNSLIDQFMSKRRKNGVKIKDCSNFTDCTFNVLYFMAKGTKIDLPEQLNHLFATFDVHYRRSRYVIHWIVCQLPALHNAEYCTFLEQNHLEHYNFQEVQPELGSKELVHS